jgi:hypothetical protein
MCSDGSSCKEVVATLYTGINMLDLVKVGVQLRTAATCLPSPYAGMTFWTTAHHTGSAGIVWATVGGRMQ